MAAGKRATPRRGWGSWLGEPRAAVLIVLASVMLFGGGRRLLHVWKARGAVGRLGEPEVSPADVEAVVAYGRAGLMELFRILGTAEAEPLRNAAGRALATIWARDDLIREEEQAVVRRGAVVTWQARRRYPRALRSPIPMVVTFAVPFLSADGPGVRPTQLEWSYRITGARRARLEEFSSWLPGPGRAEFLLIPDDFESDGPHRLALAARVRTAGLTDAWEIELPHIPFTFEFDPRLAVDALLTLPDDARGRAIARAVRLEPAPVESSRPAAFLNLSDDLALRNPPELVVSTPLPCDLAHTVTLEIEGCARPCAAGAVIVSGQGAGTIASAQRRVLGPLEPWPAGTIDRPGARRLRAVLTADPDRGWADPEVRSIWPGTFTTEWVDVEVVRR